MARMAISFDGIRADMTEVESLGRENLATIRGLKEDLERIEAARA